MNIEFNIVDGGRLITLSSPDFDDLAPDQEEGFFDWVGSEDADDEIFWSADIYQDEGTIIVSFFEWPQDPQRIVDLIAAKLDVQIDPFANWHKAVDNL